MTDLFRPTHIRVAAFVLVCMLAIPALAAKPEKTMSDFSFDFPGFLTCSYGSLDATVEFKDASILFYDQAGSLTRIQDHFVVTAVVNNPENGKSASGVTVFNQTSPFNNNVQLSAIERGVQFRLSVDGRQLPILAGRVITDTTMFATLFDTPHSTLNAQTAAAVYNALE
jgi:regulation of enolase protein 1 (concanavalin A-like superfamily)